MSKLKLIYDSKATWEKDYIRELLDNIDYDIINLDIFIFKSEEEIEQELQKYSDVINNNIFVISVNNTFGLCTVNKYTQILYNIVIKIKPIIIFQLSDEWGIYSNFSKFAPHTKILLHQHNFYKYSYNNYNNVIHLPLGYMTGMFNNKNALDFKFKPILERKYIWSFVGNIKKDRMELIDKFSNKFSNKFVGNNMTPSEMLDIYNESIFVPNGRGNYRLDCFRIYEAILAGSIPIIVCESESEINETFEYNSNIPPPFIFERTWDDAVIKCEYLLNHTEELEYIQKQNYEWLCNKLKIIKEGIKSIVILHKNDNILK